MISTVVFLLALQLSCSPGNGQSYLTYLFSTSSENQQPSVSGSQVPSTPCPRVFQYYYGSSGWTGRIYVPTSAGIDANTGRMIPVKLEVQLLLPASLPNKYIGRLDLAESKEEVWQKLKAGSPNDPIVYTVYFPLTSPLPYVSMITVNGNLLCSGSINRMPGLVITTISLNHAFYPYSLPLSVGSRPNMVNQPQTEVILQPEEPIVVNIGNVNTGDQSGGFQRPPVVQQPIQQPIQQPTSTTINYNVGVNTPTESPVSNPVQTNIFSQGLHGNCGKPLSSNFLIVNGDPVGKRGEWPWMVAIFQNINEGVGIKFCCGGTLITKYYVLTAAHCTKLGDKELEADKFTLYLGKFNLNKWAEPGAQTRDVKNVHMHPDYKGTSDSDLAMLELSVSAEYGPYVQPACMWPSNLSDLSAIVGKLGTVVGWGLDENNKITSSVPKKAQMPVVSQEECLRSDPDFFHFTSTRTFCAGYRNGTGPCNGDSGGGLVFPLPDEERGGVKWYLRGVVSTSLLTTGTIACDQKNYIIFTDIAKHSSWITGYVGI